MRSGEGFCGDVELRLVEGQAPADDPALATHLRSCLRCFRTASELRDVPRLAALLREADQPDPGELFWAKFPASVADAWEREQAAAQAPRERVWRSMARWFQLPVPAALAGAAVAAALVLALVQRPATAPRAARVVGASAPAGGVAGLEHEREAAEEEPTSGVLGGDEDPLDGLEPADVSALVAATEQEAAPADEGAEPGPSPAEEIDLLETDDLRAVAQALRAPSRI
jgi:hypothetical protein